MGWVNDLGDEGRAQIYDLHTKVILAVFADWVNVTKSVYIYTSLPL